MKALNCLFVIGMLWLCIADCRSQGLLFYGNEKRISERASYSVFGNKDLPTFSNEFRISFDYSIKDSLSSGYILYMEDKKIGKTYSFTYLRQNDQPCSFSFNEDGKKILHQFSYNTEKQGHRWVNISILFHLSTDEAEISIGQQKQRIMNLGLNQEKFSPLIYFGKCEYILDVASFAIRNLSVSDGKKEWKMPLDESQGEEVHDSRGKVRGYVTNPVWLINQSYHWKTLISSSSATPSGLTFSDKRQEMLIFNQDSLSIFNLYTHSFSSLPFRNKLPFQLYLGMNFLDSKQEKLYAYEINSDRGGGVVMAGMDLATQEWDTIKNTDFRQQLHHHCAFYHPQEEKYILFGGYGGRRYSNTFFAYDRKVNRWDTLAFSGERIIPRYFSGMAVTPDNKKIYLYGGMGNETGDQNVGRNYLYDLIQVDLEHRQVKKLWQQKIPETNRVAARNMILSKDQKHLYVLGYPEYMPNSFLQLYRMSVVDGSYETVGDTIPIVSEEIATNANLFYNEKLGEFYCSIQEYEKEGKILTRLYCLTDPPVTLTAVEQYTNIQKDQSIQDIGWGIGVILLLGGAVYLFYYHRRKPRALSETDPEETTETNTVQIQEEEVSLLPEAVVPVNKNAIFLFGAFSVLNRQGRDITYLFSAKMRTIFLYTLLNSTSKEGVLSSDMNELFWADKPEANIKNLKGVTMNHLRKILQEIDGIELIFQKGYFRLILTEECYCDYMHFANLSVLETQGDSSETTHAEMTGLLLRGKFLASIESDLFDFHKQQEEDFVHSFLPEQIEKAYQSHRLSTLIRLCNILFMYDSLSETALNYSVYSLRKQSKPEDAVKRYASFVKDYKKMMGEDYPISYDNIKLQNQQTI